MGEQNPTPITEPVTEPVKQPTQEPSTPVVPPVAEPPKAEPKGEPNVIELLSSVDKATLLKLPVVQGILEDARQQEKNKLYKTIDDKDNTIKQLNQTISDLKSDLKTKEDSTMENEKELLAQLQAMKEAQDKLIKDMETEKENARKAELESYKATKIAGANGEIVAGLVRGNTKEEIDASIELAKQEYQNIVAPLKSQLEEAGKPNVANAPKPSNPNTPPVMEVTAEDLRAMSPAEYAKHREKLLAQARK
jgi:DNA repair exonuclease SbcCD ATPase subunit